MENLFSNRLTIYLMESLDRNARWSIISAVCSFINMLLSIGILIKLAVAH